MTAAKIVKSMGMDTLTRVSEYTGKSVQTLSNWQKHNPELFEIVVLGCIAKKNQNGGVE